MRRIWYSLCSLSVAVLSVDVKAARLGGTIKQIDNKSRGNGDFLVESIEGSSIPFEALDAISVNVPLSRSTGAYNKLSSK